MPNNVVGIGAPSGHHQQETARCEFWKRRSAAALIEQLPDDLDEAVEILQIARRLLTVPLSD